MNTKTTPTKKQLLTLCDEITRQTGVEHHLDTYRGSGYGFCRVDGIGDRKVYRQLYSGKARSVHTWMHAYVNGWLAGRDQIRAKINRIWEATLKE